MQTSLEELALPTVSDIVDFLRGGCGDFVVRFPGGKRVEPEEIWIPALACWVRADGFSYSGDMGRGYRYPGVIGRWRIRRAVARFREIEARLPPSHPLRARALAKKENENV